MRSDRHLSKVKMNRKPVLLQIGVVVLFFALLFLLSDKHSVLRSVRSSSNNSSAVVQQILTKNLVPPVITTTAAPSDKKSSLEKIGIAWNQPISEPVAAEFVAWFRNYQAASLDEKTALENKGIALAVARKEFLSELIQKDPERALELAFPFAVREQLPVSMKEFIEDRVSGRGDLAVMGVLPEAGKELEVVPTFRTATVNGKKFQAFAYGRRLGEPSLQNVPLNGIAFGNLFAVSENPVRILEPSEAAQVSKKSETICSISGDATTLHQEETPVDVGGEIVFLCQNAHAEELNQKIVAAAGGAPSADGAVQASTYTEGQKKLILIRVDFPDLVGVPFPDSTGTNLVSGLNNFYGESSFGRAGFALVGQGSDYTPTFRLTNSASYYGTNNFYDKLRTDARTAAASAGYVLANYNFDLICMGSVPGFTWSGLGYIGQPGAWIRNSFGTGVSAHELGHNYGLNHAGFWDTSGLSIIGNNGTNVEYGDSFDTMGAASAGANHFNARYKRYLNWLTTNEVTNVTVSGTYRIFCHDNTNSTGIRGLSVAKNASTNYWVEFRQKFSSNKWLMNGAGLRWAQSGNQKSLLLDTTPGSVDAKNDSAIVIGRTFSDPQAGVHITPIKKGGTSPESLDVVVNKGTFPTNVPPTITITASATNVAAGATVNFTATTADSNGDALAYYWDFDGGNFGTNGLTASTSWSAGEYVVRCTVTDMKGGTASDSVIVRVGSPTTFRISGTVKTNSTPVEGVRVFVSSTRMTYTDSDGTYNLVGLPAGTYTLSASLDGYVFTNVVFSNPVSVGPSATGKDFNTSSTVPPTIASQPQGRAVVGGSNVIFSVTATGGSPLGYRWLFNGTTIVNATNSSVMILNAQPTNAGNYSVVVSNSAGAVTSSNANLTVNAAPVLAAISNRTAAENSLLSFAVTATDSNSINFTLDPGAPTGATINSASGIFSWTPTEAQGPGTYTITIRATDNGTPSASDVKSFTATVTESNTAPVLAIISNKFVNAGATLTFTNGATDADFPANILNFSLGASALSGGATIDPTSGIFSWTAPSSETLLTNTVNIIVSDNGAPVLSNNQNFQIVVIPPPRASSIAALGNGFIKLTWETFSGKTYQIQFKNGLDASGWTDLGNPVTATSPTVSITDNITTQPQRFYRILQLD